ncbi:MAG: hypothetical protein FWF10_04165 [Clostridiales bacterium]|nr:hypothetical protein [Clostridiales bacterium]
MKKAMAAYISALLILTALAACVKLETQTPPSTQSPQEEIVAISPSPTEFTIDEARIAWFFETDKAAILALLGDDFEIVDTGAEGSVEGWHYPALGIVFTFMYESYEEVDDSENYVLWIEGEGLYAAFGLTADMWEDTDELSVFFDYVEGILGEGMRIDTWLETPDHPIVILQYMPRDKYMLEFGVPYSAGIGCYTLLTWE